MVEVELGPVATRSPSAGACLSWAGVSAQIRSVWPERSDW